MSPCNFYTPQESFEKERRLSKQSERQLQDIITSLREQLSRPSQTESDAVNELTKVKHRHFNEVSDLKNQVGSFSSSPYFIPIEKKSMANRIIGLMMTLCG